ncbi:MAG: aminotransferase class I/II-fold pyridoxal phosphate-dependent enzyme, partial [Pseudomonadota bacterium]|nr:aminotransferase class I/II-fold pyridoxal phosphate-dependent enzyme [Pseudomonadota bacterium]
MSDVNTGKAIEQHGGNLSQIAARYPQAPKPFIDLSTGINPYAYPLPGIEPEWFHRLAECSEVAAAHNAAAKYYQAANPDTITLAAGMQPLMFALASLRIKECGGSKVSILSPAYGEHERVWRAMGHKVANVEALDNPAPGGVVIVCNPNNPDGRIIPPSRLMQLAESLAAHDGWLIVDESFADL